MNESWTTDCLDEAGDPLDMVSAPDILTFASPSALQAFVASRSGVTVRDTYSNQLLELLQTRAPERSAAKVAEDVRERLKRQTPCAQGTWIHYPWLRCLVHVLDEAEFRELRTSRNRNKITSGEQERLRALRIAVAGLSVGQSTAITLAMEEVGGELRIADFDTLELSNMNRLRACVADLGIPKTILTARGIYELNPYARVVVFHDGVTEQNVDEFLGGERPVDILVEECDDLAMKLRLRERARELGIAVVMETSDRGMLDIELFGREPNRPILHGLVAGVSASQVRGMTTREKVPIVLRLIGAERISERLAASLVDVDTTLKTWPQLASAVALGAGAATDACRRIALGSLTKSGRFYVDLEEAVGDGVDGSVIFTPVLEPSTAPSELEALPPLPLRPGGLDDEKTQSLLAYAVFAPSGGNCQPWKFQRSGDSIRFLFDSERSSTMLDFEHSASYMAIGSAVESCCLLAPALGLLPSVVVQPRDEAPECIAEVCFAETQPDPKAAYWGHVIASRATNRKLGRRVPLGDEVYEGLESLARMRGARLQFVREPSLLDSLGELLAEGDRMRMLHRRLHREMMSEIRWTAQDARSTRDGIDVETLELAAADVAGMRLVSNWRMMSVVKTLGVGRGLEKPTRQAVAAASALGLLTIPGNDAADYFKGGRVLQRVWLETTKLGLGFQPMTAILYTFAIEERGQGEGFDPRERGQIVALRERFKAFFDVPAGTAELILFRLAAVGTVTARSLRKPVAEMVLPDGPKA